jgi:hypothetical protein
MNDIINTNVNKGRYPEKVPTVSDTLRSPNPSLLEHQCFTKNQIFDLIFIQTNDAYKNRLRQIILEGLKIGKGAVRCRPPVAPYVSTHLHISNTLSELSKPDDREVSETTEGSC